MKSTIRFCLLLILVIPVFSGCKDDGNHIEYVNNVLYREMLDVYLWYDEMPRPQPDPSSYSNPQDYLDAIKYADLDRWSYIVTQDDNQQYFEEGKSIGHGFSLGLDDAGQIRILFVYPSTEAATKGVKRGWILSKINGTNVPPDNRVFNMMGNSVVGITNVFTFLDHDGLSQVVSLTKENYDIKSVLHSEVITQGVDKIGYIVFQDFISTATEGLDEAMESFVTADINELVIDLRYNGGGMVSIAQEFASWLVGKNHANDVFASYEFNDKYTSENFSIRIPANTNGLELDRLFFIGTENTASASEMLINGLKPFITDVILAGTTTHGKPVGMFGIEIDEYIAYPITYRSYNKNHVGEYYDGLAPDISVEDNFAFDFGDANEPMLQSILAWISSGPVISPGPALKSATQTHNKNRLLKSDHPMSQFIKAQ
jgi:carboxyl-terminal processing protease